MHALDHLRGVAVLAHLVAVVSMAIPSPEGFDGPDPLARPRVAGPVAAWSETLAGMGVPPAVTRSTVLGVGRGLERVEDRAEAAFGPYARFAGVRQTWRMFGTAPPRASRVEILVEESAGFRVVYRSNDPAAAWRAELWESGRGRTVLNALSGGRFPSWWAGLARSIARRASTDFPQARTLRLQRIPVRIPDPAALRKEGALRSRDPVDVVDVPLGEQAG